jgi:DNA-binding Xre family transcriptional regulator
LSPVLRLSAVRLTRDSITQLRKNVKKNLIQLRNIFLCATVPIMIVVTIRERAEKCGIENAYQLQKALEISPTIAARLWRGNFDKVGIVTLDRLCRVLKCQPDKLLRYVTNE